MSTEKNHSETDGFSFLIYLFSVIYISVQDSIEEFKIKPIVKNKIGIKVPFEDYSEKSVKLILKLRVDDVRKRNFMFLSKLCIDIQDDIIQIKEWFWKKKCEEIIREEIECRKQFGEVDESEIEFLGFDQIQGFKISY